MEKPISAGDLVQVVRPTSCCGDTTFLGVTFVVQAIITQGIGHCCYCGQGSVIADALMPEKYDGAIELPRLKRIPPPEELGIVNEREEIAA